MTSQKTRPIASAYVRGGIYAHMTGQEINRKLDLAETMLVLKHLPDSNFDRRVIARFDISTLDGDYVRLVAKTIIAIDDPEVCYTAHAVDFEGDLSALTYESFPSFGKELGRGAFAGVISCDVSEYVKKAKGDGRQQLCLVICATKNCAYEIRMNDPHVGENDIYLEAFPQKPPCFTRALTGDHQKDAEIWAWAKARFDEWHSRYIKLANTPEPHIEKINSPKEQFTKTVWFSYSSTTYQGEKQPAPTRTMEALTDLDRFAPPKEYKIDKFGGLMDESLRGEATGFFHVKKVGDRTWMFDPLGYPFVVRSLSGITPSYQESPYQEQMAIRKYGSLDAWGVETTRHLKEDLGFYVASVLNPHAAKVEDPIVNQANIDFAFTYARKIGTAKSNSGSSTFTENNTMNVFDPDFVTHADERGKLAQKHRDNPYILGFTTDNELPMHGAMLLSYLSLDPQKAVNHYSYACAWTWLCNMSGRDDPDESCITPELYELFLGFVWDRYFHVVCGAMRKYDPNHMMLGTRFLTNAKDFRWVMKFAGLYLDCITINWYSIWQPQEDSIQRIAQSTDCPFMVTEFYTKAGDSGLGNTTGAGQYVATQTDRGQFYQNFTLRLLEAKNCVGWHWFQYLDNDPRNAILPDGSIRDVSGTNSNKGIVSSEHEEYTECTKYMAEINHNVYRLIDYFDNKYKA